MRIGGRWTSRRELSRKDDSKECSDAYIGIQQHKTLVQGDRWFLEEDQE